MHGRRTSSSLQEAGETQTSTAGNPWSRQGGAICSISLLLLGAALLVYGGALMTIGHKPLQEGQEEQWRRIARIRMHQIRKESMGNAHETLTQTNQQPVEAVRGEDLAEPYSKHVAAKIKHVFENIITSEELPRQPGSLGSLRDHLSNTANSNELAQPQMEAMQSLQEVTAASLNAERPH